MEAKVEGNWVRRGAHDTSVTTGENKVQLPSASVREEEQSQQDEGRGVRKSPEKPSTNRASEQEGGRKNSLTNS